MFDGSNSSNIIIEMSRNLEFKDNCIYKQEERQKDSKAVRQRDKKKKRQIKSFSFILNGLKTVFRP